jgi:hypothetical protein
MPYTHDAIVDPVKPETDLEIQGASGHGDGSGIRCPVCGWTPAAEDRWMCECGHLWNTFDTGGVCPSCLLKWTFTCCLACHLWSPHSDWYAKS